MRPTSSISCQTHADLRWSWSTYAYLCCASCFPGAMVSSLLLLSKSDSHVYLHDFTFFLLSVERTYFNRDAQNMRGKSLLVPEGGALLTPACKLRDQMRLFLQIFVVIPWRGTQDLPLHSTASTNIVFRIVWRFRVVPWKSHNRCSTVVCCDMAFTSLYTIY